VENLTPASATATIVRRAGILAIVRNVSTAMIALPVISEIASATPGPVDRGRIFARETMPVARSARSSRAAIGRILTATTAPRAVIATMHVRLDVLPTGNLADRKPYAREKVAARSGPTRRAAKVFAKMATVRVAIGPLAPGRRVMAIAPRW